MDGFSWYNLKWLVILKKIAHHSCIPASNIAKVKLQYIAIWIYINGMYLSHKINGRISYWWITSEYYIEWIFKYHAINGTNPILWFRKHTIIILQVINLYQTCQRWWNGKEQTILVSLIANQSLQSSLLVQTDCIDSNRIELLIAIIPRLIYEALY